MLKTVTHTFRGNSNKSIEDSLLWSILQHLERTDRLVGYISSKEGCQVAKIWISFANKEKQTEIIDEKQPFSFCTMDLMKIWLEIVGYKRVLDPPVRRIFWVDVPLRLDPLWAISPFWNHPLFCLILGSFIFLLSFVKHLFESYANEVNRQLPVHKSTGPSRGNDLLWTWWRHCHFFFLTIIIIFFHFLLFFLLLNIDQYKWTYPLYLCQACGQKSIFS